MCTAASTAEARNPRNEENTDAERRRTAVFYGHYEGVCNITGVDDDKKCATLFEVCAGSVWMAHGVLHALLHRTVPAGSKDDMLRLLPVSSIGKWFWTTIFRKMNNEALYNGHQ